MLENAFSFYENCKSVIKYGKTFLYGTTTNNTHHLQGTQVVLRRGEDNRMLLVCHSFLQQVQENIEIELLKGNWRIERTFGEEGAVIIRNPYIVINSRKPNTAFAIILAQRKRNSVV